MDYQSIIDDLVEIADMRSTSLRKRETCKDAANAITELIARAEAAEEENKDREEASFREHSETHYWRDRARSAEKDRDHWRAEALAVTESDLMRSHAELSKEWAKEKKRADQAERIASELCDDFINYVITGVPNPAPYCANRCPECVDGRGWCNGDNFVCRGFSPKATLKGEKDG